MFRVYDEYVHGMCNFYVCFRTKYSLQLTFFWFVYLQSKGLSKDFTIIFDVDCYKEKPTDRDNVVRKFEILINIDNGT